MNIYDFNNYRDFLKSELASRLNKNPKYSLRAMAKALDMGSSTLSEVLSGRTNLSLANARKIATRLNLKKKEICYFCDLVQYSSEKDVGAKEQIIERLRVAHPQKRVMTDLSLELFKQMSDWYHAAILELPLIEGFEFTTDNISRVLGIPKPQAELAVDRLFNLGLLEIAEDGKILRRGHDFKVFSDVKSAAMRTYYNQMLEKVSSALEEQSPKERLSGYLNLPIHADALPEVDEAIDRFFADLKRIADKRPNKNTIYHLSLHFINMVKENLK